MPTGSTVNSFTVLYSSSSTMGGIERVVIVVLSVTAILVITSPGWFGTISSGCNTVPDSSSAAVLLSACSVSASGSRT